MFLDRDGTVSRYMEYCRRPEEFELLAGSGEAIGALNAAGLRVVVVTNQSAVGRGWLEPTTLEAIHAKMRRDVARTGGRIDAVFHCPHRPEEGCACRKPGAGMLLRAARELQVTLEQSYMIGDRILDVVTGRRVGATTVLVRCGHPPEPDAGVRPDHEAPTLTEAAAWVVAEDARRHPAASRARRVEVIR